MLEKLGVETGSQESLVDFGHMDAGGLLELWWKEHDGAEAATKPTGTNCVPSITW